MHFLVFFCRSQFRQVFSLFSDKSKTKPHKNTVTFTKLRLLYFRLSYLLLMRIKATSGQSHCFTVALQSPTTALLYQNYMNQINHEEEISQTQNKTTSVNKTHKFEKMEKKNVLFIYVDWIAYRQRTGNHIRLNNIIVYC